MIGFRSVQHQGHAAAKTGLSDEANPYPQGCAAFYEYQDGCNAFRRGDVIDCRGSIASAGTQSVKHASVHRQGTGW